MVTFWESSSNDTPEGTTLGNETAVTGRIGLGLSPEIEPEGDWLAAFRMAKAARELNGGRPMIYLGWPETPEAAARELAVALSHSNTWYPTADAEATMLDGVDVVVRGRGAGSRTEDWQLRGDPVELGPSVDLDAVLVPLPFEVRAPAWSMIEYYVDREGDQTMYLFVTTPGPAGWLTLEAAPGDSIDVIARSLGASPEERSGRKVRVRLEDPLTVVIVSAG